MSTTTENDSSIPMLPPESPGSSVSSSLQDEYQELLQYAIITPHYDPSQLPQTLAGAAQAFQPRKPIKDQLVYVDSTDSDAVSTSEGSDQLGQSMVATQGSLAAESLSESQGGDEEDVQNGQEQDIRMRDLSATTPVRSSGHRVPADAPTPETPVTDQSTVSTESSTPRSPAIDQDIVRMEKMLDNWSLELKRNVLAELSQSKIVLMEKHRVDMRLLKERHMKEVHHLQNEIESQKELLHTYEQSVERKDHIISNLTRAVQKEKERFEMLRRFESWKLRHSEDKRQAFTTKLARSHHEKHLKSRVWSAWHSLIVAKWRQRVEKACQAKAQEVCMKLTNDYEARIASLNEALESSRTEVGKLHGEREHYEEAMKKAFMRGVCALNMEAMAMFHETEGNGGGQLPATSQTQPSQPGLGPAPFPTPAPTKPGPVATLSANSVSQVPGSSGQLQGHRVVTSQGATTQSTVSQSHRGGASMARKVSSSTKTSQSSKTITAKVSARSDLQPSGSLGRGGGGIGGNVGLKPPMTSVVVERHHPITQQTLGHATAARYPVQPQNGLPQAQGVSSLGTGVGGAASRRIPQGVQGVPTVKVVH